MIVAPVQARNTDQRRGYRLSGAVPASCFVVRRNFCTAWAFRGEIRQGIEPFHAVRPDRRPHPRDSAEDNRLTTEVIGELAGLSSSACQRRLKRLRSEGFIEADISIVSPKAVGRPVQALAFVSLERESSEIIDRFKKAVKTSAQIVNGFYVTGEVDFVLYVTARTMDDYKRFTRRFLEENPVIKGFKTMVIMDRVKASFAVPVEPPSED